VGVNEDRVLEIETFLIYFPGLDSLSSLVEPREGEKNFFFFTRSWSYIIFDVLSSGIDYHSGGISLSLNFA
jgi:hypothetical protein